MIPDLITPEVRARLARPDSIEVVFSNGGLTSPGGHPVPLHEYQASLGVFKGLGAGDMEDRAYFIVADEAALEAKWPRILAAKPDFIKAFLGFEANFLVLNGDPLEDAAHLHRISMRVKHGRVLPPMPAIVLGR